MEQARRLGNAIRTAIWCLLPHRLYFRSIRNRNRHGTHARLMERYQGLHQHMLVADGRRSIFTASAVSSEQARLSRCGFTRPRSLKRMPPEPFVNWSERRKVIIRLCIASLSRYSLFSVVLFLHPLAPKEVKFIHNFSEHRAAFEQLREMLLVIISA